MNRLFALLLPAALLLAGCGSSSSSTAPATLPVVKETKTFTDPRFHFSFQYPANWAAHPGSVENIAGDPTWVVRISVPANNAGPEITMNGAVQPFGNFPNGKVKQDPRVGSGKFQYFHVNIAGRKGMQVRRSLKSGVNEIHTFVETKDRIYDVRIIVSNPPISPELLAGYNKMTSTFKISPA